MATRFSLPALVLALFVSEAGASDLGDYFEDLRQPDRLSGLQVSVDSLFMSRTDDMSSVLMSNSFGGATKFQTGQTDFGTMVGPMLNVINDSDSGWGAGFRYFSVLDGGDTSNLNASVLLGQRFTEHFNGLDFSDLLQFDTAYTSTLHSVEFNLRKTLRPGWTVYTGYRMLELDERFTIQARNNLPQEPAIEISRTNLSNQLHGVQIGAQATLLEREWLTLKAGGSTGLYNNHVHQTLFVRDNTFNYRSRTVRDDQAAIVSDLNLTGIYHLTSQLAFRAGLQMLWLTDVALAPEQTQTNNFRTRDFQVDNSSDIFYIGGFTGLQYDF